MKTITLTVFQDSGHAWVRFPLKRLEKLGIMNKISAYSYQRTTYAYLEEDCDAGVLVEALKANGYTIKDIKVFDKFSFISVMFQEAEQLLAVFSKNKEGRKPLITKAKDRDSNSSGGGNRFGGDRERSGHRNNLSDESREKSFTDKKPFEKKSFGDKKPFGGERKPFEKKTYGGERTSTDGKKSFSRERKPVGEKSFDKPYEKTDFIKSDATGDRPVRKRENKLTDYLEKKPATDSKPTKKKGDTSEVENFMKKFNDDDLAW